MRRRAILRARSDAIRAAAIVETKSVSDDRPRPENPNAAKPVLRLRKK